MREDNDRNLFADESDIFGEERKKSGAEAGQEPPHEDREDDSFSDDEADPYFEEEKPASPVRRILLITASIVAGIALGVGGYLFFTAGSKNAPMEKQVVKVLPEPSGVPMPPALPSDKPNVIPEIPVRTEPQKAETAPAREMKPQDSLPKPEAKKETVQKAEVQKPGEATVPAAVVRSKEKKPLPQKKQAPAAVKEKGAYYLQAGLFESQKNADAVARKIKQKGFTPTIRKVTDAQKQTMYRVTVGRYSSYKKAAQAADALGKKGVKTIVRKQ